MSAMLVKLMIVDSIRRYERNAKKHPDSQVDQIAESIRQYGFNVPILIDADSVIIAGDARYLAAKKLGLTAVPAVMLDKLTPEQVRKFRLADNKLNESKWNDMLLIEDLAELKQTGYSILDIPGFSEAEIDKLLKGLQDDKGLVDPDDVPDMRLDHGIRPGDLFALGDHRLMCGDSTSAEDLALLLDGTRCKMCFTDPPYNVNYQGGGKNKRKKIKNDHMPEQQFYQFMDAVYQNISRSLVDGGAFYICHADAMWKAFREPLVRHDLIFRQCLVWVKDQFVLGRGDYHYRHEPILYGHKKGKHQHLWNGGRDKDSVVLHQVPSLVVERAADGYTLHINTHESAIIMSVPEYTLIYQDEGLESVWRFAKPDKSTDHPTMKPVELVKRAVRNSSVAGDPVFDAFLGSGSTLIACEDLNRQCLGMELSPEYCDVIIRRWENYTGGMARQIYSCDHYEAQ